MAIGKVVVRPTNRTTISAPNYTPKMNVSITDIQGANVTVRRDGDALIYNSITGEYVSSPLTGANIQLDELHGGTF
jgi:hypothetical protein